MSDDLKNARSLLEQGSYTCVLCLDGQVHTSVARGVKPLLDWLDAGTIRPGFCAADKVVGRATAFLYCLLGAKAVYAPIMSKGALEVLSSQGIEAHFDQQADYIRNRRGDGKCPMESATLAIQDPAEALAAIRAALRSLTQS